MSRCSVFVVLSVIAILGVANGAWATYVDYTIADSMGDGTNTGWYKGVTTQNDTDPINEDQEVERWTNTGQQWDLEAVLYDYETQCLTLVGGYDFWEGELGFTSGDVFLAINGTPQYGSSIPAHSVWNPTDSVTTTYDFGYTNALDVDWANGTFSVVDMVPGATTELAVYGGINCNNGSNPWRLAAEDTDRSDDFEFSSGSFKDGDTSVLDGVVADLVGGTHYWVTFDLSDTYLNDLLSLTDTAFYSHFTMGCGNDNLMGYYPDAPVPEPMSMIMLGCIGAGMIATRKARMSRKAAK